jgi:hypothetical protein
VKSIITHPGTTSHGRLTEAQRQAAGIGQGLIRLAVGLEHADDIKDDLARGLSTLNPDELHNDSAKSAPASHRPPTGFLHLGTARTALYSWAYARHSRRRVRAAHRGHRRGPLHPGLGRPDPGAMNWLGLDYDEGPIYQMQRLERYQRRGRADDGGRHGLPLLLHARRSGR